MSLCVTPDSRMNLNGIFIGVEVVDKSLLLPEENGMGEG